MKHEKTFEAISKLKDIEVELHRLKNALEMANRAIDAAVAAEREACALIAWNHEPDESGPIEVAIRARGRNDTNTETALG